MHSSDDEFVGGGPNGPNGRDPTPTTRRTATAFGAPGSDSSVRRIDLNDAFIRHPEATFQMQAAGSDMTEAGIGDGDILLVDRALTAKPGSVIIAVVDGELRCRRLERGLARQGQVPSVRLTGNANVPVIFINEEAPLEVWGVVTTVIKSLV
jgi:DNA polymerase V